MIRILLAFLFISCTIVPMLKNSDKSISKNEIPAFLKANTPGDARDVDYFKKQSEDKTTYELKYEKKKREISITYTEDGKFLEKEEDILFSDLASEVRTKIQEHLSKRFKSYKIHETEIRTDAKQAEFIDVEVIHHEKPTGYSELSFTKDGEFVSEEVENLQVIETLF